MWIESELELIVEMHVNSAGIRYPLGLSGGSALTLSLSYHIVWHPESSVSLLMSHFLCVFVWGKHLPRTLLALNLVLRQCCEGMRTCSTDSLAGKGLKDALLTPGFVTVMATSCCWLKSHQESCEYLYLFKSYTCNAQTFYMYIYTYIHKPHNVHVHIMILYM